MKLLNVLLAIVVASWLFTFITVDSRRYYAPSVRYSFEQFWGWYGMAITATPQNPRGIMPINEAQSKYPKRFAHYQSQYQEWLGMITEQEKSRLALIHNGSVPKWRRSAIVAQWHSIQTMSEVGQWAKGFASLKVSDWYAGYLVVAVALLGLIVLFRLFVGYRNENCFHSGVALLFTLLGLYRLIVLCFLFLSSGLITALAVNVGFVPFWWAVSSFYSVCFGLLFYYWFLREV